MFDKRKIFVGIVCGAVALGGGYARAATSNGCEDTDKNDRIIAELALCSTHAYNVGLTKNPDNDADRQLMRDVVALKTTVMTQQMYKQYEYLDATIRRLKTQLEKAILTTKLQAAGASTTDGGTSTTSTAKNRNQILNGAYDCVAESTQTAAYDCLTRNVGVVRSAISSGNIGDAKRQLEVDAKAYNTWTSKNIPDYCATGTLTANRTSTENCVNALNIAVANARDEYNNKNKINNNNQNR